MINKLYSALYRDSGHPFDALVPSSVEDKCVAIGSPTEISDDKDRALIVWGGSDIDPSLYGHPMSSRTYTGGKRDFLEYALMRRALEVGIPIIGVCRGAQMACALAGGFLLQHVDNHGGYGHLVDTPDGRQFKVNSIHHQMMVAPKEVDHELLAWSTDQRSPEYIYRDDQLFAIPEGWKEPEFYYFPKIKGFAIQWHPEAMTPGSDATQFILEKIRERL